MRRAAASILWGAVLLVSGCGDSHGGDHGHGAGGAIASGGGAGMPHEGDGGRESAGGARSTGGRASGGAPSTGGSPSTGGRPSLDDAGPPADASDGAADASNDGGPVTDGDATTDADANDGGPVTDGDATTDAPDGGVTCGKFELSTRQLVDDGTEAVGFQMNAAHTGSQPLGKVPLPLRHRWVHEFGSGLISYPVVARGLVFVTVGRLQPGVDLYALDARTGEVAWGPVDLGGSFGNWAGHAYSNGRIFAVNFDNRMFAFDAATGRRLWVKKLPGQDQIYGGLPTAFGDRVYTAAAGVGGMIYAVQANGAIAWSVPVYAPPSSLTVTAEGVWASYAGGCIHRYDPVDGALVWASPPACLGDIGGYAAPLLDGRLYDLSGRRVVDAADGSRLGAFESMSMPVGNDGTVYTIVDNTLHARRHGATTSLWTFGNRDLRLEPIVVGNHVVTGFGMDFSVKLAILSATDGTMVACDEIPMGSCAVAAPGPTTGIAAAGGGLYLPCGGFVVAY